MGKVNRWYLFKARRFMPVFLVQFLAACNDNIFKNALIILCTYQISEHSGLSVAALIQIAGALFILPFFLFTPIAGEIADKYEKSFLIRCTKVAEVFIGLFAFVAFALESVEFLLTLLFFMGVHSAFFGPLKYSILPQHLSSDELLAGNGFVEAFTFIAILIGTAIGGILIVFHYGTFYVPLLVSVVACIGLGISFLIPNAPPGDPHLKIHWNVLAVAYNLQRLVARNGKMGISMYGITWLWVLASVLFYLLPAITKTVLNADAYVNTMVLFSFATGLAIGSILCNTILKGEINTRYVGITVMLLGILLFDLAWVVENYTQHSDEVMGVADFLRTPLALHYLLINLLVSGLGGFFSVPLYAFLQHHAKADERARVIAALNVNNALFMVIFAIICAMALEMGAHFSHLIFAMGILSFPMGIWLYTRLKKQ